MSIWSDYYLEENFAGFWHRRASEPGVRVLMILAVGFDPRCLVSLNTLANLGHGNPVDYIALKLIARFALGARAVTDKLARENMEKLLNMKACRKVAIPEIETHDNEGHNVAGRATLAYMGRAADTLRSYTDVVVDISGMPRGVFFPLIAYLLRLVAKGVFPNLHVTVVEDPSLDARITGREYGQADYLHTFRHQGDEKFVWMPLIGMNEVIRLDKIYSKIKGNCIEICPILPFPARSLRRVDEIAVQHSEILFERFLVSPDNLLLCDERNPFDVYRKIIEVEEYYRQRFAAVPGIGKVTTVASPLSTKSLSLGLLLAAVERSLPVCHVEAGAYQVDVDDQGALACDLSSAPTEIWLAGEPYLP